MTTPFEKLRAIVKTLRDPVVGCPWDKEQTHQSLKPYLIEESYEVLDAIDESPQKLRDELGDVLLQVVLHAQVAEDAKTFDLDQVIERICHKLITRHPHVFADETGTKIVAKDSAQVVQNWERIKQKELAPNTSILDGIPKAMPALNRAQRTGEKAARVGFEWSTTEDVRDKVLEELREFLELTPAQLSEQQDEFGDILFSLTQLSRRLGFNSEELLQQATNKFTRRFKAVEKKLGKPLSEFSLEKLDQTWEEIKAEEKK